MRFLDLNGSGKLDSQDLVTSVALDNAEGKKAEETDEAPEFKKPGTHINPSSPANAGCLGVLIVFLMAALIIPLLFL